LTLRDAKKIGLLPERKGMMILRKAAEFSLKPIVLQIDGPFEKRLAQLPDALRHGDFVRRRLIRDRGAGEEWFPASTAKIELALHNSANAGQAAVRANGLERNVMVGAFRQQTGIPEKPLVWFGVVLEAFWAPPQFVSNEPTGVSVTSVYRKSGPFDGWSPG
jgi:hypothetical protein